MFCGLIDTICDYFLGATESYLDTEEHRGIIEKITQLPSQPPLPLSDEEPIEPVELADPTYHVKMVDGFEFEITATEAEFEAQKEIFKARQPIQVIYHWDRNTLSMPQATEIHPLVQTNFVIKTWSEVLDDCDIDYNAMVRVSTDPEQPLKMEFMQ